MKKINNNNKFRGNAVYSLNYKFDSVSPAGKCNGTALDLIKRYNELAKEAQNNGDYVGMEVFRQYAEHYRKIVTEINERKYQTRENQNVNNNGAAVENAAQEQVPAADNGLVETQSAELEQTQPQTETVLQDSENTSAPKIRRRRNFTVVEVSETTQTPSEEASVQTPTENAKPRRRPYVRKNKLTAEPEQTQAQAQAQA